MMDALTDAERAMVADNLGLIGFTLDRWFRYLLLTDHDDAWQDGFFGLCLAVRRYDETKAKFSTFACWWIRQSIQRGRGEREGVNFRRLMYEGRSADYQAPLSIELSGNLGHGEQDGWRPEAIVDEMFSDDDPETEALDEVAFANLVARCELVAESDLDRDIIAALVTGEPLVTLAAAHGVTAVRVGQRRRVVMGRLREAVA